MTKRRLHFPLRQRPTTPTTTILGPFWGKCRKCGYVAYGMTNLVEHVKSHGLPEADPAPEPAEAVR